MYKTTVYSNTRSMSSTRRMAAPTNQQYQPLCTHTKTKFKYYFYLPLTEQGKLLLYPPSIPVRGPHHDCYSPSATNAQKCESPVGLCEFLPDLAYVGGIINETTLCICLLGLCGSNLQFSLCLHTCVPSTGCIFLYNN